jgi:hypothetical protein
MILYVNGCSHSTGYCKLNPIYSHGYITAASLFGKNNFEVLTYTDIQADPFMFSNYQVLDKLENDKHYLIFQPNFGKSNDRILFESINFLYESNQRNIKIDFSIIQWSGPNRTVISKPNLHQSCTLYNVNAHDNPDYGLKFEPWASATTIQHMVNLQYLYQKYNIPYVYIPYMEVDKRVWNEYTLSKDLDLTRFTTHPIKGHRNDFRKRCLTCDTHGHPSELGSYILSSLSLNILGYGDSLIGIYDYYGDNYSKSQYLNEPKMKEIKKFSHKLGDATNEIVSSLIKSLI